MKSSVRARAIRIGLVLQNPDVAASGAPTGIGHSQITDPFGSVVAAYDENVRIDVHDIDLTMVGKAREQLAVLANETHLPVNTSAGQFRRPETEEPRR